MIIFILNDKIVQTEVSVGMPLLDFIRENQQQKGTKIGCREGDCGACTVLMGSLQADGQMQYKSITSCISPLGNANGKHIVTIEGLNLDEKLNTAQQAMVDHAGTQCGFCTPGFAVSLTGAALNNTLKYEDTIDAVSGNICRCTGYKSIERAAYEVTEKLVSIGDDHSIQNLIQEGFLPAYFAGIPDQIKGLQITKVSGHQSRIGGGTDLYVRYADHLSEEEVQLLNEEEELKEMTLKNNHCTLGAGLTVSELASISELNDAIPNLKDFIQLISSEQIRNMGTIAGNFVNASPIGDLSIFFLALDASLRIIGSSAGARDIHLKDFFKGYKDIALQEDEIIQNISFLLPGIDTYYNFEKVSKRTHLDIASVNSAIQISVKDQQIQTAHISIGGVSAIPKYLFKTSSFIQNKPLEVKTILAAAQILQEEISPISDVRGSADYKRLLAKRLFFAHFIELFPTTFHIDNLI